MKRDETYSFRHTPKELIFKLFHKKRCPKCSGKMKHFLIKEYTGLESFGGGDSYAFGDRHNYNFASHYKCLQCETEYSLQELMAYSKQQKRKASK